MAVGFFAVVLLLLLIFILQNGTQVSVNYLGAHGHLPLGVALLLSAVCGVLLVVLAGAARISQLRTVARRHRRADTKRAKSVARESAAPPARSGRARCAARPRAAGRGVRGVAQHDPRHPGTLAVPGQRMHEDPGRRIASARSASEPPGSRAGGT